MRLSPRPRSGRHRPRPPRRRLSHCRDVLDDLGPDLPHGTGSWGEAPTGAGLRGVGRSHRGDPRDLARTDAQGGRLAIARRDVGRDRGAAGVGPRRAQRVGPSHLSVHPRGGRACARAAFMVHLGIQKGLDVAIATLERTRLRRPDVAAIGYGIPARPRSLPDWVEYVRLPSPSAWPTSSTGARSSCVRVAMRAGASRSPRRWGWRPVVSTRNGGVESYAVDHRNALLCEIDDVGGSPTSGAPERRGPTGATRQRRARNRPCVRLRLTASNSRRSCWRPRHETRVIRTKSSSRWKNRASQGAAKVPRANRQPAAPDSRAQRGLLVSRPGSRRSRS